MTKTPSVSDGDKQPVQFWLTENVGYEVSLTVNKTIILAQAANYSSTFFLSILD